MDAIGNQALEARTPKPQPRDLKALSKKNRWCIHLMSIAGRCTKLVGANTPRWLFLLLILSLFAVTPAKAQLYTASLTGIVKDSSGAIIPGAKATMIDRAKGTYYSAVSDAHGRYLFLSVPPSTYSLKVEARGFKTYEQQGITLAVNQSASVEVVLQVGSITQTVNVSGAAPLLRTQDAVTGQEVTRTDINDLPLIGRDAYDLTELAPGVTPPATGTASIPVLTPIEGSSDNNYISNGGRNLETDVLLDGVTSTVNDYQVRYPAYMPSIDAIQEFNVEQNNFSADTGFSGGTVINVILRSGTNQFHGSLYEFFRDGSLDANNWFNNASNIPIPPLRYNDFGGTIGGPIRKDKTFFFFDYEGSREGEMATYTAGVPSAAEKGGDFSGLCGEPNGPAPGATFNAQGMCSNPNGQLWDPYSGVFNANLGGPVRQTFIPFNNMATFQSAGSPLLDGTVLQLPARPGNLIDPVAEKMFSYFPAPNVAVGTPAYNPYDNWAGSGTSIFNDNHFDAKIDSHVSNRVQLSGRFSDDWGYQQVAMCWDNPLDPCSTGPISPGSQSVALNAVYSVSPNKLLNLSYGFVRGDWIRGGVDAWFPSFSPVTTLGMPSYIMDSGVRQSPFITLGQYVTAGPNNLGEQGWSIGNEPRLTHDVLGNFDDIAGRHEFKTGAEFRVDQANSWLPGTPTGDFYFDQFGTSEDPAANGGDALASFLTGTSTDGYGGYEFPLAPAQTSLQYAVYGLDNWKATTKLTVNMGLRYSIETPTTERHNQLNYFDPTLASPLQVPGLPNLMGGDVFVTPSDRTQVPIYWDEVQPRFGLAYRIGSNTVFRAGYGIFYGSSPYVAGSPGYLDGEDGFQTDMSWVTTYQNNRATPGATLSNPFPDGLLFPTGSKLGALTNVGFTPSGPIRAWNQSPQTQTWSLGFEHQLPGHVLVDANYVGTKGTHLIFAGFTNLNYLGSAVENLSQQGIAALESSVPNPFYGIVTNLASPLSASTVPEWQLRVPSPQFNGTSVDEPLWANSIYNAFQLRIEKRFSNGLEFLVTYVNSKSLDDASVNGDNWTFAGGFDHFQDPNRLYLEYGLSEFDVSQVLQPSYVYQLPFGPGKRWGSGWPGWADALLGGWQTNGIWRFGTGFPIPLSLSGGTSLPTYGPQQPNLLAPLQRNNGANWRTQYFANPQVAVVPAPFTLGDGPPVLPNVRAPGEEDVSLSLFKEIPVNKLREGSYVEVGLETFNAFNYTQFCAPASTVNLPTFGQVTCQYNSPREVQLRLKLYW
jgi:Carboxypeptidase regulatory-like domain